MLKIHLRQLLLNGLRVGPQGDQLSDTDATYRQLLSHAQRLRWISPHSKTALGDEF